MFGKRILILVAHPDDEIVACAASIARAKTEGATVAALYLTHGCLDHKTLWRWQRKNYANIVATRLSEGERAASFLGIEPLGWSSRPARHLWQSLTQVFHEAEGAIANYKPDQLWVPAYEGGNPDHDGLNAIGYRLKSRLSVLEFAEYNYFGGKARSHQFISGDDTTRVLTLTAEEQVMKKQALQIYKSEKSNLSYVGLEQESYRPLARYDYAQPPHQGKLWYARFQWVPFEHPRVDYTQPKQVSEAILKFLANH